MDTIAKHRSEPAEPDTLEPAGRKQALTERATGWLLFLVSLVLLLITAAIWILIHNATWDWQGDYAKPPLQWADWLVASLAGALLYVLVSVAYWMIKQDPQFKRFTAWYISTIIKGPILAWVILVFVTGVSIEISGLTVDFSKLNALVLVVVAFALGFYGSVAREQMNQIVKALFPKAYGTTEEQFDIVPRAAQVVLGKSVQLKTSPLTEVTWQAPSAGKLEDGLYTAPTDGRAGQIVQIVAVPKDPNIPRAIARVTLTPFEIKGRTRVTYGSSERYQIAPMPAGGVTWSVSPEIPGAVISADGVYTAPDKDAATAAKINSLAITAISTANTEDSATLRIHLVEAG